MGRNVRCFMSIILGRFCIALGGNMVKVVNMELQKRPEHGSQGI